jgi:hypothetical protein
MNDGYNIYQKHKEPYIMRNLIIQTIPLVTPIRTTNAIPRPKSLANSEGVSNYDAAKILVQLTQASNS